MGICWLLLRRGCVSLCVRLEMRASAKCGTHMELSENWGVPYFEVLIIRILLFRVLYQGPPIFGNPPAELEVVGSVRKELRL